MFPVVCFAYLYKMYFVSHSDVHQKQHDWDNCWLMPCLLILALGLKGGKGPCGWAINLCTVQTEQQYLFQRNVFEK